jgi:hypothetical protein
MLFDFQRPRPSMLDRVAQPMQRADTGIAAPGEDQLVRASHPDELIVDKVGGHPHQGQIAPALADDLVAGGRGNQMSESLQRDDVAVVHEFADRHLKIENQRHRHGMPPALN